MKHTSNFPLRPVLSFGTAVLSLLFSATSASAIEFDFESSSGYSVKGGRFGTGSLVGQQQSDALRAWRGPSDAGVDVLRVVAEPGGHVLRSFFVNEQQLPFYVYDTTPEDLGGNFDPLRSRVTFAFRMRYDEKPKWPVTSLLRVSVGDTSAPVMRLEFLNDGRVYFNNGAKSNVLVSGKDGQPLKAAKGAWLEIGGAINYATRTYTISVNGVSQQDGKTSNLGFMNAAEGTKFSATLALRDMASGTEGFVPYSLDDFKLRLSN